MANKVLLTGAGFSKNFGGFLAREMSDHIFNDKEVQKCEPLRNLLENNDDYETIYQEVMGSNGKFIIEDQMILNRAIKKGYDKQDKCIQHYQDMTQTYGDLFQEFIFPLRADRGGSGYIFTLNQDLLIENRSQDHVDLTLCLPVVSECRTPITLPNLPPMSPPQPEYNIPKGERFEKEKNKYLSVIKKSSNLSYIKLHGSHNWFADDNRSLMIIGHGKSERIHAEPLLAWYFELFEHQINQHDAKILIIGYGFKDEHINKALNKAAKDYNLKIYVLNTADRIVLMKNLNNYKNIKVKGYWKTQLEVLFPLKLAPRVHPDLEEIKSIFFN